MPDVKSLKRLWGNRILETDTAVYLVRLDTEKIEESTEKLMLEDTDMIISTIVPKNYTASETTYIDNFKDQFPQTYPLLEKQKKMVGFVDGPRFYMGKKTSSGKGEMYALIGSSAFLIPWGTYDLYQILKLYMRRRSFVKGIILGVLALTKFTVACLNIEHLIKLYERSKEEYLIMPEKLQGPVLNASKAQTIEAFSLKGKPKQWQKPVVYLILPEKDAHVIYFLQNKNESKDKLADYKKFLNNTLPQVRPENTSDKDFKKTAQFYRHWYMFQYVLRDNGKWELSTSETPLFE